MTVDPGCACPGLSEPGEPGPRVSVIVPVYNAEPHLVDCLRSAFAQTIGPSALEVVAVDDGSTDGSSAVLESLAGEHPQLSVFHQANSGGAGAPRNRGLERARGEYVFFLDADDHLGVEAFERMLAAAERTKADVVMGKVVGAGTRGGPRRAFRRSYDAADLFDSGIYYSLTVHKLFRRDLIDRYRLRFPEGVQVSNDLAFTAHAFFHAETITVLTDYAYYYWRGRIDGGNVTERAFDLPRTLGAIGQVLALVGRHTKPGPGRDLLVTRHLAADLPFVLCKRFPALGAAEREKAVAAARAAIEPWVTDRVLAALHGPRRQVVDCILSGQVGVLAAALRS